MTIRSNPPGAFVYVDDYPIGTTPVSHDFTYYGNRKIRLVKDGYETLTVLQPMPTPWYEIPPLDFFSENLVPGKIRDHRCLDYTLRPLMMVPPDQLLGRADELRRGAQLMAPGVRINPAPVVPGPALMPAGPLPAPTGPMPVAPGGPAPIASPQNFGGQPVYPLPGR